MKRQSAISAINKHGMLLVFPIDNASVPPSLWSVAYPRSKMRWEWDEDGDDRVGKLWHLREQLSISNEVIYTKWYRGRATFFSREVFTALLSTYLKNPPLLSQTAKEILSTLECDSPLSTKTLKRMTNLQGRFQESLYTKAMKELWSSLMIVAYGEVDEGAFPSLAIGATKVLFEDIFEKAQSLRNGKKILEKLFQESTLIEKFYRRTQKPNPMLASRNV